MKFKTKSIPNTNLWISEPNELFRESFRVSNYLFSGKSEFQAVDVVDTPGLGKVLLNDGLIMVSERDEFAYHDMITHVPLYTHPNPKNVLVIGGGDGGTAREVLRHSVVEKCVMVEIDEMVVDACKAHIQQTASVFDNGKLELRIEDAVKYVAETSEKFDVIIVDSTDPIGPAQPLFGIEFYENVHSCLTDNGVVVSQGESPWFNSDIQESLLKVVNGMFPVTTMYNFSNLTYPGGLWSFMYCSEGLFPPIDFNKDRFEKDALKFNYYTEDLHRACFALPAFMKDSLAEYLKTP